MTTLTATRQPETASIALELEPTATVTQVIRSDSAGTRPVRALAGQLPTSGATLLVDYEAALSGPITYTAIDGGAGASVATALDLDGEWLVVPRTPAWSGRLDVPMGLLNPGYSSERESAATIVPVIGRADPLVNLGVLRLRSGAFDVWCPDAQTARTWEGIYARGEVVQLRQQVPGLDMYHVATRTRIAPDGTRWRLTVDYQEVAWPAGDLLGTLGWTYDDGAALSPTYAADALLFETYNDRALGPLT